jgi:AAA15 family ATPase/GTPase
MLSIIILFFAIGLIYVSSVLAQPDTIKSRNSTEINWLQVGVSSGVIAVAVSAIVNYIITIKKITADRNNAMAQIQKNYENTLNQLALQRQVDSIKEKLQVYSFFIFNLDRMIWNPDFR